MNTVTINTLQELSVWTQEFLKNITPTTDATIITLTGNLGAGKTALVKEAAQFFGITETITSPTFVIQKEYEIDAPFSGFKKMVHIDAYRLEGRHDLEYLGWETLIKDPNTIIFLEWPELVKGIKLNKPHEIEINIGQNNTREISLTSK